MSELSDRLFRTARDAEMEAHADAVLRTAGKLFRGGIIVDAYVRATVVAVLRELSEEAAEREYRDTELLDSLRLSNLADEIERGTR